MTVSANGKSIVHKGHGQTQLATAPDVCKTPSPAGPVPIPYPNMSPDSNLTDGAATVTIGGNPVANTGSKLSRSNGDEAGTAGGVVSSKNMGAFTWPAGSIDVEAEGKGVVRMLDAILTNGNMSNDAGVTRGKPLLSYGADLECPRQDCKLDRKLAKHKVPETVDAAKECTKLVKEVEEHYRNQVGAWGRMVGVGQCGPSDGPVHKTYKAISGGPSPDLSGSDTQNSEFIPAVTVPTHDPFMSGLMSQNKSWTCAAVKIISSAKGHRLIALSEKWVGTRTYKIPETKVRPWQLPLFGPTGAVVASVTLEPLSRPPYWIGPDEIKSGESAPSCGMCQELLPALICKTEPCG